MMIMIEKVLVDGAVFLGGLLAGIIICLVTKSVIRNVAANLTTLNAQSYLAGEMKLGRVVPAITGLATLLIWLQPAYKLLPFYTFAGNILLIWFLTLVAIIDYFTHLIYLRMLLVGSVLLVIILGAITFLDVPVGIILNRVTGVPQVIKAKEVRKLGTTNFVQLWPLNLVDSLFGAIVGGLVFGLFYLFSRLLFRNEGFGSGDVLLAIFIGLALGFQRSLLLIVITIIVSLIVSFILLLTKRQQLRKNRFVAYGPFLCAGAIFCLAFGTSFS